MGDYKPPKVWTWDAQDGGQWTSTNRPVAGPTHEAALPEGEHRFQLHSLGTPNGQKVTILLEELLAAGFDAEYDAWLIDIGKGDQFGSGFVELNPNSKIPALRDKARDRRVFESGAILLYLAEEFGAFLGEGDERVEALNWLFWLQGSAPYLGGGFGHFYAYAPYPMEYPIDRFAMEAKRQLDVLNRRLAEVEWLGGGDYSIADIATFPWYGNLVLGRAYDAAEFLSVHKYEHVLRWARDIDARPAVVRGRKVNRPDPKDGVRERHSPADLD